MRSLLLPGSFFSNRCPRQPFASRQLRESCIALSSVLRCCSSRHPSINCYHRDHISSLNCHHRRLHRYRRYRVLSWELRALERGYWDATCYCIDCYKRYYICSYRAVCHRLGSIARAAKKALYDLGGKQNAIPDTESTICAAACPDLARYALYFRVLS